MKNWIPVAEDASSFSVKRRGETVIAPSPLGLDLAGAPALGPLALASRSDSTVDLKDYTGASLRRDGQALRVQLSGAPS